MWGAPSDWTPVRGKTCPGKARIGQVDDVLARCYELSAGTVATALVPSHDEMEDEVPYLMIRDDASQKIYALFPGGKIRHIGGAEWKHYTECGIKMVSAADQTERDLLAAHGI